MPRTFTFDACRELLGHELSFRGTGLRTERMVGPEISRKKKAMSNENNKRYLVDKVPAGGLSNPSIVVLETYPEVRKAVTRKYSDGQVLSLDVVSDKIVEKMMDIRAKSHSFTRT
jgi:hypothetical protein